MDAIVGRVPIELAVDRIVSSPYVRARQTAEIVARVTGYDGEIHEDRRLIPYASFDDVSDLIAEHADAGHVLFTGHEPNLGIVLSGLVAEGRLDIEVKKASVHAVSRPLPTNYILGRYPGPRAGTEDYYALRIATAVLSGQLFGEIRSRRNLTYAVDAPFIDRGVSGGGLYVTTSQPGLTVGLETYLGLS